MENFDLRALGALLGAIGSILLAWRVRNILYALSEALKMHEANFKELHKPTMVIGTGTDKWIERAQGMHLLVLGFLMLGVGGALQFIGFLLS